LPLSPVAMLFLFLTQNRIVYIVIFRSNCNFSFVSSIWFAAAQYLFWLHGLYVFVQNQ
jgi:hypothetical protein